MKLKHLLRAVYAESLKLKRSLALLAALLIPLVLAFANFMNTVQRGIGRPALELTNPWSLYLIYALELWVIFALPLLVSVLAALLADLDHRAKAWKQLFALPFPRSTVFASKWLVLAGITLLSTLVFGAANLAGGILVHLLRPELGLGLPIPVLEAFIKPLIAWLLALFMISIHLWISLWWPSFLVSVTVGFAASISNIFLINSKLYEHSFVSPWAMPIQAYDRWQTILIYALLGAVVTVGLAGRAFVRRDMF